VLGQVLIS
ncbi:Clp, N terminal domain protein, partial [Vibrio parahaemolyticus VPTS-2010]